MKPRELLSAAERVALGVFHSDAEWLARCRVTRPHAYPFALPDTPEHLVEAYALTLSLCPPALSLSIALLAARRSAV